MAGGADNDTYFVDNSGDVVTENANEGIDTVQSSVAYTLAANVENLTLTDAGTGTRRISRTSAPEKSPTARMAGRPGGRP